MSSISELPSAGRALSPGAIALMRMLCLSWGVNQIAVKLVLADVPPMLQALSRSAGALPVLLILGGLRGGKCLERDGALWAGVCNGIIVGIESMPSPLSLTLMAYQAFWVVGLTFTLWFALVKAYSASKLSAFTFITPLFGVVASYVILHDTLTLAFGAAALLVVAGLYLVNRPEAARAEVAPDPNV